MTPTQCIEARRLLGWSQANLARRAGAHEGVVGGFERIGRVAKKKVGGDWIAVMKDALEAAGVEFVDANGGDAGVRMKAPSK